MLDILRRVSMRWEKGMMQRTAADILAFNEPSGPWVGLFLRTEEMEFPSSYKSSKFGNPSSGSWKWEINI